MLPVVMTDRYDERGVSTTRKSATSESETREISIKRPKKEEELRKSAGARFGLREERDVIVEMRIIVALTTLFVAMAVGPATLMIIIEGKKMILLMCRNHPLL